MTATTVLLVDDNPDLVAMTELFLHCRGFRVLTTTSPNDVAKILAREVPDVMVLDLMMPELNGSELARLTGAAIPVVFYSAADEGSLEELQSVHPDAHIVAKGAALSLLEETIRTALALGAPVRSPAPTMPAPAKRA